MIFNAKSEKRIFQETSIYISMTSLEQTMSCACIRINIFNCKHVFKEAG